MLAVQTSHHSELLPAPQRVLAVAGWPGELVLRSGVGLLRRMLSALLRWTPSRSSCCCCCRVRLPGGSPVEAADGGSAESGGGVVMGGGVAGRTGFIGVVDGAGDAGVEVLVWACAALAVIAPQSAREMTIGCLTRMGRSSGGAQPASMRSMCDWWRCGAVAPPAQYATEAMKRS